MKKMKFAIIVMMFAGSLFSCEKDIDMSKIDFSNIENLYEQPLPVIQKCVEGKWKWYVSYGGESGVNYSEKTFVDIQDDQFVVDYYDGSQITWYFTWKKCSVNNGYKTYVMWEKESNKASWYFHSIKNDTLIVFRDPPPGSADIPYSFGFVRVK